MPYNKGMIPSYLPLNDRIELARQAKEAARLEVIWRNKAKRYYAEITDEVIENLFRTGRLKESIIDFEPFLLQHLYEVSRTAITSASRLARPPKQTKVPSTLEDLRKIWKQWRERRDMPPRQRAIARKLKERYLKKIRRIWEKHSEPFRKGETFDQDEAVEAIRRGAKIEQGRAVTTVNTETTHHYNQARRNVYDKADDVTHYLFLCIRDHRTTRWCSTRTGLVYAKGDPLLDKETPPIHWNCRSEIAPLTPNNPQHLKLIEDPKHRRRNHTCEPLPKNWRK